MYDHVMIWINVLLFTIVYLLGCEPEVMIQLSQQN